MDTGATGSRRYGSIGSTPRVGRIAGGRTTEIAPTEAVAATASATESDSRSPDQDREHDHERRFGERYALAAELRQALLSADGGPGAEPWQLPGPVIAELYREIRAAATRSGPVSQSAVDTAAGARHYARQAVSRAYGEPAGAAGENLRLRRTI